LISLIGILVRIRSARRRRRRRRATVAIETGTVLARLILATLAVAALERFANLLISALIAREESLQEL
jgi:hypothetical protein